MINEILNTVIKYLNCSNEKSILINIENIINKNTDKSSTELYGLTYNFWEKNYISNLDEYGNFKIPKSTFRCNLKNYISKICDNQTNLLWENNFIKPESIFFKDYKEILKDILNGNYKNWDIIEKSLGYWQDAINDKHLEQSMLVLKFIYVYKKAEEILDLKIPDKIYKFMNEILATQA